MTEQQALFEYCLRIGDNGLVLGHRLSEWCGHGPVLEEDIAMSNMALDLIGQARGYLGYAAKLEAQGRSDDELAFKRDARQFRNHMLVEQPNGDFALTMMRSFLYSAFAYLHFRILIKTRDHTISGLAEKSLKEITYHLRHCSDWIIRLGDGTDESHERTQQAAENLWSFTSELFEMDAVDELLIKQNLAVDLTALQQEWNDIVNKVFAEATIQRPDDSRFMSKGGIKGIHTEHLGFLLAEMQFLPRAYPGTSW